MLDKLTQNQYYASMSDFTRKRLKHGIPFWVNDGEVYFITINCQQRGANSLAQDQTAHAIKNSIQRYTDLHKWWPKLIVLMPDHLHALLSLNTSAHSIKQIVSPWKSYLKKTQEIDWQEGFFEHRIRNQESLEEKAHYLRLNPVRAQLVDQPEQWPYIWNASDFQR